MNVLYDAQIFRQQRYGGISRYFSALAPRVAATEGFSACVLAPRHDNAYLPSLPFGVRVGWRSASKGKPGRLEDLAMRVTQKATLAWFRPDVVHETYYWGPFVHAPRALRVLTIYDMIHERYSSMFRAGDPTMRAKRHAAALADHVICISESTRRDAMEFLGLPASKLSVTYLSADLLPPSGPRPVLADGRPYLLYVGERGGYKNFLGLVAALAQSTALREVLLVCCGGGALKDAEWQAIDERGLDRSRVLHRAADDETLAAHYAGALCFVYPSLFEGFGIPPLEAMQCGCPVACSNTSSIPEVVGDAGVYFDPADVESIRHAIEQVATSETLREDLRTRGRQQLGRFSWDRCARETVDIYRRLSAAAGA